MAMIDKFYVGEQEVRAVVYDMKDYFILQIMSIREQIQKRKKRSLVNYRHNS